MFLSIVECSFYEQGAGWEMDYSTEPNIFIVGGIAITSSLDVAQFFEVPHSQILNQIKELGKKFTAKEFSEKFDHHIFFSQKNKPQNIYSMNKEGFKLLNLPNKEMKIF